MSIDILDVLGLFGVAALGGTGLLMLFRPERWQTERSVNRDRKLADRLQRGHDAYFEELRTLQSYGKPLDLRTIRLFGAGCLILSAGSIILFIVQIART